MLKIAISLFLLIMPLSSGATSLCASGALDPAARIISYDVREALKNKGLDPDLVRFRRHMDGLGIEVELWYGGSKAASIFLNRIRIRRQLYYESHTGVVFSYTGKGLGLLLYVLGAKIVNQLGANLVSSRAPSEPAIRVWDFMIANGWAEEANFKRGTRFRFVKDVVSTHFDDLYAFYLGASERPFP